MSFVYVEYLFGFELSLSHLLKIDDTHSEEANDLSQLLYRSIVISNSTNIYVQYLANVIINPQNRILTMQN